MGTIYKRGETYWINYYRHGKAYFESSKSDKKMVAAALLKTREGEIAQGKVPGIHFDKIRFDDLAEDLLNDYKVNSRKSIVQVAASVEHLKKFFGGMFVKDISTAKVNEYVAARMEEDFAPATINRQLAALKRMLNMGAKCTPPKVDRVPHIPMLKERNIRKGFFEHGEYVALVNELPDNIKPIVTFGYRLGWRKSEILGLQWSNVDLGAGIARLEPNTTKNEDGRTVYLDDELKGVLKEQKEKQQREGRLSPYVFPNATGEGSIHYFRRSWNSACKRAGISGKIFHDLRRTAVRNMVRAGIPERVAMMISGHRTRNVFQRYDIVDEQDLQRAAQRHAEFLAGKSEGTVTKMVTIRKKVTR